MEVGVQKTAEHAVLCKKAALLAVRSGSETDAPRQQPPLVKRVYYHRARAMDKLMSACCTVLPLEARQTLFLGAGLDVTLETAHCNDSAPGSVFCVDFAQVLESRGGGGASTSANGVNSSSILVAADLRDPAALLNALHDAGFDAKAPTVVVMECVLAYMPRGDVERLLQTLNTALERHLIISYDPLFSRRSGYTTDMMRAFARRGAPVHFSNTSADAHHAFFRDCGGAHVACIDMLDTMKAWGQDDTHAVFAEPFDEFHTLALTQRHYVVTLTGSSEKDFGRVCESLFSSPTLPIATAEVWNTVKHREQAYVASKQTEKDQRAAVVGVTLTCLDDVRIVHVVPEDLHALYTLLEAAFEPVAKKFKTVRKFIKTAKADMKKTVTGAAAGNGPMQPERRLMAARMGATIVGCVGVSQNSEGVFELQHMCVSAGCRGQGLGAMLLGRALECARELATCPSGDVRVHLSVVRDLEAARRLYARGGFVDEKCTDLGGGCVLHHMRCVL